ncbi:NACHT domain-containing protein [Coleofasciculus sp. FACHB-1120]|uniref:NACHT C-terminal helical domain 2-containing protein n=1 Tax=Coleofasciculus sp. FACHB-1120 TaxID=2692783 RepID=UPI00168490C9|nr:NACHT domain-containing protein [Coleofasciculus sp. FACHB-1120]MBD2744850.1 NACHT domain-containing protein [Coleofasciculus sp. FACHB-1120]
MTYPEIFLQELAKPKRLSPGKMEVFLALFGQGLSREQIAQQLGNKPRAVSVRLTGVYEKFGLGEVSGPVKEKMLGELLADHYRRWKAKQTQDVKDETEIVDELNALVRKVRAHGKDRIINKIGTMRMLRVREPVQVNEIYVDLNLLEQSCCDLPFAEQQDQLEPNSTNFRQQFDRIGRSQPTKEHIPALDIIRANSSKPIMILGKPGAGKTTLLKSLAVKCVNGELDWEQKSYVPIFITLKTFADDFRRSLQKWEPEKPLILLQAIQQELKLWGITDEQVIERLVTEGRFWLLLDGLDEVSGDKGKAVVQQIRWLCDHHSTNRITVTCRTQQQKYRFDNSLIDVEVADFTPAQVQNFLDHWFKCVLGQQHQVQAESLSKSLFEQLQQSENKSIAELAVTPILLNLICVYAERNQGTLPQKRASLYEMSIRCLLTDWDKEKVNEIERLNLSGLDVDEKEALLSYLAFTLFEQNIYIASRKTLIKLIKKFHNYRGSEAEIIMKSLEAEHGLLIERAEGYWSFSHLTLQEYFVARWFTYEDKFESLKPYLPNPRWNEVFFLALELSEDTIKSLNNLKNWTDEIVASHKSIQSFLSFTHRKSKKTQSRYNSTVIRAYYFNINAGLECHDLWEWEYIHFTTLPDILGYDYEDECEILAFDANLANILYTALSVENHVDYALSFGEYAEAAIEQNNIEAFMAHIQAADVVVELAERLEGIASQAKSFEPSFLTRFQKLYNQINSQFEAVCEYIDNLSNLDEWWNENGFDWLEELNDLIISCRDIGYRGLIETKQDTLLLEQYRNANELIVKCLASLPEVDTEIKNEIEETLLLPIKEIQRWNKKYNRTLTSYNNTS